MTTVIIYLKPNEVDIFIKFREYQTEFIKLVKSGVLDLKSGDAIIHKDHGGNIGNIEVRKVVYP